MQTAISDLRAEIAALEEETQSILKEVTTTVGDLSDLRYGKFPNVGGSDGGPGRTEANTVAEEVIREIKRVESICLQGQGDGEEA
jgi:centromere-localized protein 2